MEYLLYTTTFGHIYGHSFEKKTTYLGQRLALCFDTMDDKLSYLGFARFKK